MLAHCDMNTEGKSKGKGEVRNLKTSLKSLGSVMLKNAERYNLCTTVCRQDTHLLCGRKKIPAFTKKEI